MKLLFGTRNQGKLTEAQALLAGINVELVSLEDFSELDGFDVEETGATFNENAALKAKAFGDKTGILSCSDDSGLEVVALGGKPGVFSKRFLPGTDAERNLGLLKLMAGQADRRAQVRSVLCLYDPVSGSEHFFEGIVTGKIATQSAGDQGFGYDPIFIPDGYDQTYAQLGVEEKNKLSHRAQAFARLKAFLAQ